jgi:putative heme-binding domain-containing protein
MRSLRNDLLSSAIGSASGILLIMLARIRSIEDSGHSLLLPFNKVREMVCRYSLNNLLFHFTLVAVLVAGDFSGQISAQEPPSAVGPLLKLYRSGKLPPERQPAVVEMICARGNEHDLRVVLDKLIEPAAMTAESRQKAIAGLTDAAATRKIKPAGDLSGLAKLLDEKDPNVRLGAVQLVAACHVPQATPSLRQLALDENSDQELRRAAINGLVTFGGDSSRETLTELAQKSASMKIRLQAAAGLVGFDVKLAASQSANLLRGATPQDDFIPLLDSFFARKEGSQELATSLKSTTLSIDVAKRLLRTMYGMGRSDAELSAVLSHAAGIVADAHPPKPEEIAALVQEVSDKGDPARGEHIFRRADLSCMRCHSVSRAGGQVGPELSAVGGTSPIDYVANSILNPNLAVKEQYVTRMFELSDGKVLSGVVVDRDDTKVRIRDAQGKLVIIPKADIEEETAGVSMMPQGMTKFLTHDELLDLIRFVSELGKPGEYAVQTTPRIQRWQLLASPAKELISEVPHLDHLRQYVTGLGPEAWSSVYGRVSGILPLEELRQADKPTVVILRGEFDVKEAGVVAFHLENTEHYQAWIDTEPAPSTSDFEVTLQSGRHALILRVEISNRPNPELRATISHPAGSTARFEIIGGM